MKIKKISWKEFDLIIKKIGKSLKNDFDLIVAIQRGGLVPATCLSHLIGIREIKIINIQHSKDDSVYSDWKKNLDIKSFNIDAKNKKIIVIDDIAGTGKTLDFVLKKLKQQKPKKITSVVLFMNDEKFCGKEKIDIVAKKTRKWVVFPWEKNGNK